MEKLNSTTIRDTSNGKTIVCITTRNRSSVLELCLIYWRKYTDVEIIIVDDASQDPIQGATYRFAERVGIPRAKNKCIEIAMLLGAEHIFLVDDDTYPLQSGVLERYSQAGPKHLCYTFTTDGATWNDGEFTYHGNGNGCMLYIHRSVIETIGGFDTNFGIGKYEHTQFSYRAYAAGLIPEVFIDLVGSGEMFYCMDQNAEVVRSLTPEEDSRQRADFYNYFQATRYNKQFIKYV